MDIEATVFERYSPKFDEFEKYGFKKDKNSYTFEKFFCDEAFRAIVSVDFEGRVSGKVYDLESNDEYLPLRVQGEKGSFCAHIQEEYKKLLEDIRDNCFNREYFIYPQSNRIAALVAKKYGSEPEFLWDKFKGSAVFRNQKTKKWFLAILDVDYSKIDKNKKGLVEVADVKLESKKIVSSIETGRFYPAYHMNKKSWITFVLDETVSDREIMELVEESFGYSEGKAV